MNIIEIIYEIFITDMKYFYESSVSSREHYDIYADIICVENTKLIDENNKNKDKVMKLQKDIEFYEKRKHDMFVDQLQYDGKGNFCKNIINKLNYMKYDFCNSRNSDITFENDMNNAIKYITDIINKYTHYYDKSIREEVSVPYMNLDKFREQVKENYAKYKHYAEKYKLRIECNTYINESKNEIDGNTSNDDSDASIANDPDDFIVN